MTYFLIFLAVMVAAAAALYVVGLGQPRTGDPVYNDVLAAPVANLPPVLLPGEPEPGDVDKLRFSLGLRGYRMDQVDEVLDRLRDELAAKDARIAELEVGMAGTAPVKDSAEDSAEGTVNDAAKDTDGGADAPAVSSETVPAGSETFPAGQTDDEPPASPHPAA